MKKQRIFTVTVVALVALLFSAGPVEAKSKIKTKFSGIRYGPTQLIPPPGEIWQDPPGVMQFVRGNLFKAAMELKLDGEVVPVWIFYTMNANFELPDEAAGETANKGPMWGTFWFALVDDLTADPIFEGVWTSYGGHYNYRYKSLTGYGMGEYLGLKMKALMWVVDLSIDPSKNDWFVWGHIKRLP